jgi:hypothetical protein
LINIQSAPARIGVSPDEENENIEADREQWWVFKDILTRSSGHVCANWRDREMGFAEFCGWVLVSSRRISWSTHRLRTQGEMLETPALSCCSDDRPGLITQL